MTTFTQDDLDLLREAAAMLMCHLETGDVALTRDDLRCQGKKPPAFDFPRLEKADRARKLWMKLLAIELDPGASAAVDTDPLPVGQRHCLKCGAPESDHPYRHPFQALGTLDIRREK